MPSFNFIKIIIIKLFKIKNNSLEFKGTINNNNCYSNKI